tara:strand:+ start:73 stop:2598 length:2526 start_codon:yes stop_codon:yes gene_type:complete
MITINKKTVRATGTPSAGGTQSNELQAAIKSVTSSTTVGAVFLYSTKDDSDGGKWRSKCKGLSWFDEPTLPAGTGANQWNSATRSARSEFPAMALIVADNESGSETLNIYDLDDPAMPLWMSFTTNGAISWAGAGAPTFTSVCALNGRVYLTGSPNTTFLEISFAGDDLRLGYQTTSYHLTTGRDIASRNVVSAIVAGGDGYILVDDSVNDVAATWLEGGELDSMGLVRPVIACATDGGVSVIHPSGDVYDIIESTGPADAYKIAFTDDAKIVFHASDTAAATDYAHVYVVGVPYADVSIGYFYGLPTSGNPEIEDYQYSTNTGANLHAVFGGLSSDVSAIEPAGENLAIGSNVGLSVVKRNTGSCGEGAVAYITSAYNSGYMVGDIRGAWLANSLTADRSVKGNTLTQVGTVPYTAGLGVSADITAIGPFSASNYLKIVDGDQSNDYDFNGTDDFSIMFWLKDSSTSTLQNLMARGNASQQAGDWLIHKDGSGRLYFYRHDATDWRINADNATSGTATARYTADGVVTANQWTQVVAVRRSSKFNWYVNGELSGTPQSDTNTYNPSATLVIGTANGAATQPAINSSLSLLRISATAPTPQQIKEIYDAEKPLFAANAKCTLGGNSVNDLAFDKSSGLLYVCNSGDSCIFRGLEYIEELTRNGTYGFASGGTLDLMTAAGGVHAASRTSLGVGANLPSLDVRAELNEGESKIPDDGKLHFEGVTVNATPTVIGHIPMVDNDYNLFTLKIVGHRYNSTSAGTSHRLVGEIKQAFNKPLGQAIEAESVGYKLIEEQNADLDVTLEADAASGTVRIKVTGDDVYRMQWTASVEVQRISDKTYER